jgi:hypothetical protein
MAGLGRRCADGTLSVSQFIDTILAIESGQMHPLGLILSATNTREDWVNVTLKVAGSGSPCTQFEFLPATGKFRQLVQARPEAPRLCP